MRDPVPLAAATPAVDGDDSLFEWLPIGAYRCTPAGMPLRVNTALARLHGFETGPQMLAELGRPDARGWYVDPGRRAQFRDQLTRHGEVTDFVSEIRRQSDGQTLWVSECAHLVRDEAGRVTGYQGTLEDITGRKQAMQALQRSDELLRQLTWHFPGVVFRTRWRSGGPAVIDYISDGVRELYGVEPDEVLRDSTLLERMRHPDDAAAVQAGQDQARRDGRPHMAQFRIVRADGQVRWVQGSAAFVAQVGREEVRTGVILDVTAQHEAASLRAERDQAEAARRASAAMLSRVSHELRTPLNAVLGFGQLMEHDASLPERQQAWAAQIVRSGRHLLALVEDVLGLTGLSSGEARLDAQAQPLGPVVEDCLAMVASAAAKAGIDLAAKVPPGLAARGDARRLRQALSNLLSNAVKYNRPGGQARVEVSAAGSSVRLAVHDQGQGLTPEQIGRLFQPFERLGAELGPIEGTGLGLALTRELAAAMGGSVEVESRPGQGSCFTLVLPAADANS